VGALTPLRSGFEEREKLMVSSTSDASERMHDAAYCSVGGVAPDLPEKLIDDIDAFSIPSQGLRRSRGFLINGKRIFKQRKGISASIKLAELGLVGFRRERCAAGSGAAGLAHGAALRMTIPSSIEHPIGQRTASCLRSLLPSAGRDAAAIRILKQCTSSACTSREGRGGGRLRKTRS